MFFALLLFLTRNCQIPVGRNLQINILLAHSRQFSRNFDFIFVLADFQLRLGRLHCGIFVRKVQPVVEKAVDHIVKVFVSITVMRRHSVIVVFACHICISHFILQNLFVSASAALRIPARKHLPRFRFHRRLAYVPRSDSELGSP